MMHAPLHLLLLALVLPLCLGIIVAVICRLRLMHPSQHKLAWGVMYLAMATYAGNVLVDVLDTRQWPDDALWWALLAIALNLALTHRHWHAGPPAITRKPKK